MLSCESAQFAEHWFGSIRRASDRIRIASAIGGAGGVVRYHCGGFAGLIGVLPPCRIG